MPNSLFSTWSPTVVISFLTSIVLIYYLKKLLVGLGANEDDDMEDAKETDDADEASEEAEEEIA